MSHAVRKLVRRLHADERGAEGMERLLLLAAIIVPLVGLLVYFSNEIDFWADSSMTTLRIESDAASASDP